MERYAATPPLCLHQLIEPSTPIVGLFIGISQFQSDEILDTPAHALAAAVMAEPFYHAARSATTETPVFAELRAPVYAFTQDEVGKQVHLSLTRLHSQDLTWADESHWDDDQYLDLVLHQVTGFTERKRRSLNRSDWTERKSERFVTRETILELVKAAASKAASLRRDMGAATLVVYLSSHGWIGPDGRQYIVPSDADPDRPASWLSYDEILELLHEAQVEEVPGEESYNTLAFFDSCQFRLKGATKLRPTLVPPRTVTVTAAAPGQYSYHWTTVRELGRGTTRVTSEKRFGFPKLPRKVSKGPFVIEFTAKMSVIPRANQLSIDRWVDSLWDSVDEKEEAATSIQVSVVDWARELLQHKEEALSENPVYQEEPGAQQDLVVLEGPGRDSEPFLVLSRLPPVLRAVVENDVTRIERLAAADIPIDAADSSGRTPLLVAALEGEREAVETLLRLGADVNRLNKRGASPLLAAAMSGDEYILKALLESGAEIDKASRNGTTALMLAATFGESDAVRALLEAGANVNARNDDDRDALSLALEGNDLKTIELLVEFGADTRWTQGNGNTLLMDAVWVGNPSVVDLLIRGGADINSRNMEGIAALHIAAELGNEEIVQRLIESGADLEVEVNGATPLLIAASQGQAAATRYLLEGGANATATTSSGANVLMLALNNVSRLDTDLSDVLALSLEAGAEVNATTDSGVTALMVASLRGEIDAIRTLLNAGADTNARDSDGDTPLIYAARASSDSAEPVLELMRHGAIASVINLEGKSAATVARERGNERIAEALEAVSRQQVSRP